MFRISKQFHFSAAHQLDLLPDDHPCSQLHGHNYIVEAVLESEELDHRGFVVDYAELEPIKTFINENLDHLNLNDVLTEATTAENIARFLYEKFKPVFPALAKMRVSESPRTWAEYEERQS
ncbi:MAG: 6-carboxytetrahydropterin synthase [Thermoanaerobaculia bacterium]